MGTEAPGPAAGYVFDNAWEAERRRLAGIEASSDPATTRTLAQLGLCAGWHCAEVAAGGGSIAAWLCEQVGPAGRVVATDLDTRFLAALSAPQLVVQQHDIVRTSLEPAAFDLVHARLLLEHLPDRDTALAHLVAGLRPGGWLVVEDYDWTVYAAYQPEPRDSRASRLQLRLSQALLPCLTAAGQQVDCGRALYLQLRRQGLIQVQAEGHTRFEAGGSPWMRSFRLSLERLRERLIATGGISAAEVEEALQELENPDFVLLAPLLVSAWGRRPA